jgi:hypothetical protein
MGMTSVDIMSGTPSRIVFHLPHFGQRPAGLAGKHAPQSVSEQYQLLALGPGLGAAVIGLRY